MSTAVSEVPAFSPLVAITATARMVEGVERVRLNSAYVRALESAGLVPIVVPPLATGGAAVRVAMKHGLHMVEPVDGIAQAL